jgi:HTH-type transcriptional regulator/antitoxin HipB
MKGKHTPIEVPVRSAEQLGRAFERFRDRSGVSQTELGRDAGVRQATVSKVERGADASRIETIFLLCASLGLELVLRERGRMKESAGVKEWFR